MKDILFLVRLFTKPAFRRMPEASVYLTGRWDVRASVLLMLNDRLVNFFHL